MADIPPSQSLYVSNLNHKVKKEVVRRGLYALFGQFGRILDVVVSRAERLRGQAWVVFHDIGDATNALRRLQGFPFFDRAMRIQFAKGKSFAVAREDGTFFQVVKARDTARAGGSASHGGSGFASGVDMARMDVSLEASSSMHDAPNGFIHDTEASAQDHGQVEESGEPEPAAGEAQGRSQMQDDCPSANAPHNTLIAAGLPPEVTAEMMEALFRQYNGFVEVRLASGQGVAFVEYSDIVQAGVALDGLNGFKLTPTDSMSVTYAKK